ncbi:hypothetical protein FS749_014328 [Ceratobasidium sp. UAMH 11750]|nr:hypothetical protein FS749_014328 [Ceratobasidium sp. UAMH 11750]
MSNLYLRLDAGKGAGIASGTLSDGEYWRLKLDARAGVLGAFGGAYLAFFVKRSGSGMVQRGGGGRGQGQGTGEGRSLAADNARCRGFSLNSPNNASRVALGRVVCAHTGQEAAA